MISNFTCFAGDPNGQRAALEVAGFSKSSPTLALGLTTIKEVLTFAGIGGPGPLTKDQIDNNPQSPPPPVHAHTLHTERKWFTAVFW